MGAISGVVSKAVEPLTKRLDDMEKALKGGGKLVKIGDKYMIVDPEKMNASTADPTKLPGLTVVQPTTGIPGTPGGQLVEPKPPRPGFIG